MFLFPVRSRPPRPLAVPVAVATGDLTGDLCVEEASKFAQAAARCPSSRGRRVRRAARLQHWHLIGRDFITDFLGTIVGRLVAVALPLLSPKTFMDPSPRFRRVGVKRLRAVVQWKGPRHAVVTLDGPHDGRGHLLAGVVEVRLELLR